MSEQTTSRKEHAMEIETVLSAALPVHATKFIPNAPWHDGKFVYATDGKIIIRTKAVSIEGYEYNELLAKKVNRLNWGAVFADEVELPSLTPLSDVIKQVPCRHCRGTGHRECDMGHEHECDECDGEGSVKSTLAPTLQIGNTAIVMGVAETCRIALFYAHVLLAIGVKPRPVSADAPIGFAGPNFDGLVMPANATESFADVERIEKLNHLLGSAVAV